MVRLLIDNEKGQSILEYSLIVALISIAVLATLILLGPHIAAMFQTVNDTVPAISP